MAHRFCDICRRFVNSAITDVDPLMSYHRFPFSYMSKNQVSRDLRAIESRPWAVCEPSLISNDTSSTEFLELAEALKIDR